jgi:hypothetical protein
MLAIVCVCVCTQNETLTMPASQYGSIPLCAASENGHLEIVRTLLAEGADVEAKGWVSIAIGSPVTCAVCPCQSLTHTQNSECMAIIRICVPGLSCCLYSRPLLLSSCVACSLYPSQRSFTHN